MRPGTSSGWCHRAPQPPPAHRPRRQPSGAGAYVQADVDTWLARALAAHRGHYADPAAREAATGLLPQCVLAHAALLSALARLVPPPRPASWRWRPGSPPPNPRPPPTSPRSSPAPLEPAEEVGRRTTRGKAGRNRVTSSIALGASCELADAVPSRARHELFRVADRLLNNPAGAGVVAAGHQSAGSDPNAPGRLSSGGAETPVVLLPTAEGQ
jgi:hypothetical protein